MSNNDTYLFTEHMDEFGDGDFKLKHLKKLVNELEKNLDVDDETEIEHIRLKFTNNAPCAFVTESNTVIIHD